MTDFAFFFFFFFPFSLPLLPSSPSLLFPLPTTPTACPLPHRSSLGNSTQTFANSPSTWSPSPASTSSASATPLSPPPVLKPTAPSTSPNCRNRSSTPGT
jgi:hypothetical protein